MSILLAFISVWLTGAAVTGFRPLWWIDWNVTWNDIFKFALEKSTDEETTGRMKTLSEGKIDMTESMIRFYLGLFWPLDVVRHHLIRVFG